LAFVHADLDQYESTLAVLRWSWERLSPGGILCAHDWFPEMDWLAAGAIRQFAGEIRVLMNELPSRHAYFVRD